MTSRPLLMLCLLLGGGWGCTPSRTSHDSEDAAFRKVMEELADAWNRGDARAAANCFTEDAVYSEPPDRQLFHGRDALFEFFGGDDGRAGAMQMEWHNLAYNPETAVGFGEFSFTYGSTSHGIVAVKLRDAKIANWREIFYDSELSWDAFVSENPF